MDHYKNLKVKTVLGLSVKNQHEKDLAKLADVSTYTIAKISKGENVTTDTLGKICKWILGG